MTRTSPWPKAAQAARPAAALTGSTMQLKAMIIPPAPCCRLDASIATARQIMQAYGSRQVLVLDERRRLLGRVRRADLPWDERALEAYLRRPVFWLRDDASLDELAQLMRYQRLQHVPISDAGDAIYGIVNRVELARWRRQLDASDATHAFDSPNSRRRRGKLTFAGIPSHARHGTIPGDFL